MGEDRCVYCDFTGEMFFPGVCQECHDFGVDARATSPPPSPEPHPMPTQLDLWQEEQQPPAPQ